MSGHTAGPWFVTGQMTLYVEARIGGGMLQEVAAVGPTQADEGYGEQQRANARLIAAAPELLEALEQAVTSMQDNGWPNSHLAVRSARAAIAKARGES